MTGFDEMEKKIGDQDDLDGPTIEIEGSTGNGAHGKETLDGVLRRFLAGVLRPDDPGTPITLRIRASYGESAPLLRQASKNSAAELLHWARSGSPFRAILVISIGAITCLALTGLLAFMSFFLVATVNAVIISLLISLATAGGALAIFFGFLAAIYVGTVSVAMIVISTITIVASIAVLFATGWVAFFWIVWMVAKKSMDLAKDSLTMTGSVISAYSGPCRGFK